MTLWCINTLDVFSVTTAPRASFAAQPFSFSYCEPVTRSNHILYSWEFGTQEETLIELNTPSFSVLNDTSLPPSHTAPDSLNDVIEIITKIIEERDQTLSSGNFSGPQAIFPGEGSAADPASNGVAALIANWTGKSTSDLDFGQAAEDQMAYLWSSKVPKTADGAISHRVEQAQLWYVSSWPELLLCRGNAFLPP